MLHVHRAERADGLVAELAELLLEPSGDPLAAEVVAVPTRGMERWLAQRLSGRLGASPGRADGVCANVRFPPPRALIEAALAGASGIVPDEDPWLPEHSVWPLLITVEECLGAAWLRPLALHLGAGEGAPDPVRRARRLSVVRHLATLLYRYARHRPEMVQAWSGPTGLAGPSATAETAAAGWQGQLWRALRERIGVPDPAERLAPACERLRAEPQLIDLPPRLSVFGLTRMPRGDLAVLHALAEGRDVHLFLLHPSPALWRGVSDAMAGRSVARERRLDPTAELAQNPLLASWARDSREMQLVVSTASEVEIVDHHHPLELRPVTLLERLQADVIADRVPPGEPLPGDPELRAELEPGDRSVQIHACRGRARQVEVLREAILHRLKDDPTLEPRDIIVMCPDIESFAPLITAVFGAAAPADGSEGGFPDGEAPELRVRLADRSLRQTNPLLSVVGELLDLVDARLTASQVLDLADREPVRQRFDLDDEDLARVRDWVGATGIRWGLDAAHRTPFKLARVEEGTWQAGLDRLLVGITTGGEGYRLFADRLPLDGLGSDAIDLAGRFTELIARLREAVDALTVAQPVEGWTGALAAAADALAASPAAQAWQRQELGRLLEDLEREGGPGGPELTLPEIRGLLADRLAGRPTRANFRTGHLTICTLYPMRSVPHRVVCLLGLDDGAFPRQAPRDGDDLMLEDPHLGERDPRSEDRQLLLDALLAAREHLLITYTAADERTNLRQPPAVPISELLDAIDATVTAPAGPAREQVVIGHPLQPFDPRNFTAGALVQDRAWSFDPMALAGARALEGPRSEPGAFLASPLPVHAEPVVELEELVRFVCHPVRTFLRRRLRVRAAEPGEEIEDRLPVHLDGLERWEIGQRLLDALMAGVDGRSACLAEIARGALPPGQLGAPVVRELYPVAAAIASCAEGLVGAGTSVGGVAATGGGVDGEALDLHLTLPDGRRLSGTVDPPRGDVLLSAAFSRLSAPQRLRSWVRLLAATAAAPERPLEAVTVGRGAEKDDVRVARIAPLGPDPQTRHTEALAHLEALVALMDRGLCEPLLLPVRTSAAYAAAAARGEEPLEAARGEWESGYNHPREDQDSDLVLVLGGVLRLEELLAAAPELPELAARLWEGLLAREQLS